MAISREHDSCSNVLRVRKVGRADQTTIFLNPERCDGSWNEQKRNGIRSMLTLPARGLTSDHLGRAKDVEIYEWIRRIVEDP